MFEHNIRMRTQKTSPVLRAISYTRSPNFNSFSFQLLMRCLGPQYTEKTD